LITGGPPEAEHLDLGHEDIEVELTRSPRHTAERWTTRARATAAALSDSATPPDRVSLHGWPLGAHGAVVARSFELWTHTDDIRRALGRPVTTPLPEDLRTMSSFSVQGLPFTLALTSPGAELTPTRVVLTGPGGGTFDIGASGGGEAPDDDASTLIVVNVVDYCRVVARRLTIDDLDLTITGDQTLARSLLQSSSAFAL
ncbi:MAG: hypothetical protein OEW83_14085, partial [Acidimicrobiia bacterium]|nr:hypothetical protein [Acidimicrobiia bacterium]